MGSPLHPPAKSSPSHASSLPSPATSPSPLPKGVSVTAVSIGGVRGLVIDIPAQCAELPTGLTEAEREIVTLLLEGRSNQEIATLRGRSYRTVANQLAAIYRKLSVASRAELIASLDLRSAG
jgi:DNA-binding CsgD family transcriptional regulator